MTVTYLKAYQKSNARSQILTAGFVCYSKNWKNKAKKKQKKKWEKIYRLWNIVL